MRGEDKSEGAKVNNKAQVVIEFTLAFICLVIFLLSTARLFVWFGNTLVRRHKAFEDTRVLAGNGSTTNTVVDFYNQAAHPLRIYK